MLASLLKEKEHSFVADATLEGFKVFVAWFYGDSRQAPRHSTDV
jgi:hypothetical protein